VTDLERLGETDAFRAEIARLARCQSCGHEVKCLAQEVCCRAEEGGRGRCWSGQEPPPPDVDTDVA
jgi:hypothetical protein